MIEIEVDNGKYKVCLSNSGQLTLLRHNLVWIENPPASKMIIAMAFELKELREKCQKITTQHLLEVTDQAT